MDIIKWRDSYETGIDSMDMQHKQLIGLINRLYNVIRNKESIDSKNEVLGEMTEYAEKHLQEEESLLRTNDYPGFSEHIALHQGYRQTVKKLVDESKDKNEETVNDTYTFLRQWWMGHIMAEDKKYGEFLKSKGVK